MPPTGPLPIRDAPSPADLLVLDAADPERGPAIDPPAGARLTRVTTSFAFETALRTFRRGVVAIVAPPATSRDLQRLVRARRSRSELRIALVNEPADAAGRIAALAAGFDDAMSASIGRDELAGRLLVLARRVRDERPDRLAVGPGLELDLVSRALRRDGRLVHLRPLEFRLLERLAREPGRPLSRRQLLLDVWGTDGLEASRTVDVHIRWLRLKVEADPERPERLLTVRGIGYQLEPGTDGLDARDVAMAGGAVDTALTGDQPTVHG